MATPKGNAPAGHELWSGNAIVSGAQPGYPGVNVYLAGGTGVSGNLPVEQADPGVSSSFNPWYFTVPAYQQSSFGQLRVATPYTLIDLVHKYGIDTFEMDTTASGGDVRADLSRSAVRLQVDNVSGSIARIRTNTYFRYQAGRGHHVIISAVVDPPVAGQIRGWGYTDDNDGLFWRHSGSTMWVARRTSTGSAQADYLTPQASWNVDPMDGTGPSGIVLDPTKGNIYEMKFQWLGVGNVEWYINGNPVHVMYNANTYDGPYMRSAILPLAARVANETAVAASGSGMRLICANVTSEGGQDPPQYGFSISRGTMLTGVLSSSNFSPLVAIRLSSLFNGVDNRIVVFPNSVECYVESNSSPAATKAEVGIFLNPALSGGTWQQTYPTSGVEFNYSAVSMSGGVPVDQHFVTGLPNERMVDLGKIFAYNARKLRRTAFSGLSDILVVGIRHDNSNPRTVDATAVIKWTEVR